MKIESGKKLNFSDVMIKPQLSKLTSRKDVNLMTGFQFKYSSKFYYGVPIVAANLDSVGTLEMYNTLKKLDISTCLHKFHDMDTLVENSHNFTTKLWYSMGISDTDLTKFEEYKSKVTVHPDVVCIDIANGYQERLLRFVSNFRAKNSNTILVVGNVCTPEMTELLIEAGADVIKIGIGPGKFCSTSEVTGVGYPQLSAILECADAAHLLGAHICADGGCKAPGDVAKAFVAGADMVMLGSMFAATDECNALSYELEGTKYYECHGMSSNAAMLEHYGKKESYRASEGKEVLLTAKGSAKTVAEEILGGLRSACSYVGASSLKELHKKATFIKV